MKQIINKNIKLKDLQDGNLLEDWQKQSTWKKYVTQIKQLGFFGSLETWKIEKCKNGKFWNFGKMDN